MDKNNFSTFLRNNINDRFWDNYIELVRNEMIPYQLMALNDEIDGAPKSYCLENFKKAAKAAGEKSIEMLHLKDLTKVTGYIRGGCTHYIEYLNRHCTVRTENSVKNFADENKAELERIEVVVRISAVKIAVVKTAVIVE